MRKIWIILLLMAACLVTQAGVNNSLNGSAARLPFFAVIDGNANPAPIDPCTLANHETGSGRAIPQDRDVQFLLE
jgi:hypothetical protein